MEDEQIIELFWARDEAAILKAREKYGGFCRALAQRLLGSVPDAEECVADMLLRLWSSIPPQRPASLRAYMAKITRNLSIDRWRNGSRGPELAELTQELEDALPGSPGAESEFYARAAGEAVDRWLRGLSKEDRTLFVRRYYYGETVRSIARGRGVPEGRLAQKLLRLRASLRRALEKEGIQI